MADFAGLSCGGVARLPALLPLSTHPWHIPSLPPPPSTATLHPPLAHPLPSPCYPSPRSPHPGPYDSAHQSQGMNEAPRAPPPCAVAAPLAASTARRQARCRPSRATAEAPARTSQTAAGGDSQESGLRPSESFPPKPAEGAANSQCDGQSNDHSQRPLGIGSGCCHPRVRGVSMHPPCLHDAESPQAQFPVGSHRPPRYNPRGLEYRR